MKTSDNDLEQLVIGSLMNLGDISCNNGRKAFDLVKPSMFINPNNKVIFENISKLVKANRAIELIELNSLVESDGTYQEGFTYLPSLHRNVAGFSNLLSYAKQLRERAQKRFAMQKISDVLMELQDDHTDSTKDIMAGLGSFVDGFVSKQTNEQGLRHISDIMPKFLEAVDNRFDNPEKFAGHTTGIEQLDDILGAKKLRKGTLFVVGARPKMGKTMLKSKLVNHFAIRLNTAVLDYSMEMLEDEVVERAIADDSGVSTDIFYRGSSKQDDWGLVGDATARLNKSNLYINDKTGLTLAEIKAEARMTHRKHKVGLIAIDYLTLMKAEKAERNDLAYGEITKGLKGLAKELECVVMLLTQLNRGLEGRSDKRPMPSDSRDTGQIEQDCDYWVGIYREAVYSKDVPDNMKGYTEIELRLNRHGDVGRCYMDMNNGRFEEIDVQKYALMDHMKQNQIQSEELE